MRFASTLSAYARPLVRCCTIQTDAKLPTPIVRTMRTSAGAISSRTRAMTCRVLARRKADSTGPTACVNAAWLTTRQLTSVTAVTVPSYGARLRSAISPKQSPGWSGFESARTTSLIVCTDATRCFTFSAFVAPSTVWMIASLLWRPCRDISWRCRSKLLLPKLPFPSGEPTPTPPPTPSLTPPPTPTMTPA